MPTATPSAVRSRPTIATSNSGSCPRDCFRSSPPRKPSRRKPQKEDGLTCMKEMYASRKMRLHTAARRNPARTPPGPGPRRPVAVSTGQAQDWFLWRALRQFPHFHVAHLLHIFRPEYRVILQSNVWFFSTHEETF